LALKKPATAYRYHREAMNFIGKTNEIFVCRDKIRPLGHIIVRFRV
jgi:hypothetical protein